MTLITDSQMAAIREWGVMGMTTSIRIYRQMPIEHDPDSLHYDETADYGDDDLEPVDVHSIQPYATTTAWLVNKSLSMPQRSIGDGGDGQVPSTDVHIIRVPVDIGRTVRVFDIVEVIADSEQYIVSDTNSDDTHPEWTKLSALRRQ